jgi:hypothetical protein
MYPMYYIRNDEIKYCGLLNISKKRSEIYKQGNFNMLRLDGTEIAIPNIWRY